MACYSGTQTQGGGQILCIAASCIPQRCTLFGMCCGMCCGHRCANACHGDFVVVSSGLTWIPGHARTRRQIRSQLPHFVWQCTALHSVVLCNAAFALCCARYQSATQSVSLALCPAQQYSALSCGMLCCACPLGIRFSPLWGCLSCSAPCGALQDKQNRGNVVVHTHMRFLYNMYPDTPFPPYS